MIIVDVGASGFPSGNPFVSTSGMYEAEIYLFEPLLEYYNKLEELYGERDNFHLYNLALSDRKGEQNFFVTGKPNCSSLRKPNLENEIVGARKNLNEFEIINVKVETLENVLGHLDVIDYLKLDTQGTEYEVLVGAGKLLDRIGKIHCEINHTEWYEGQKYGEEITRLLTDRGFELTGSRPSNYYTDYTYTNRNLHRK